MALAKLASSLYRTHTTLERTLRISYPAGRGEILLRTELDCEKDLAPKDNLSFPHAEYDDAAWGVRLHLPTQMLNGAVARSSRLRSPVLG
jgi:hypothetical protein